MKKKLIEDPATSREWIEGFLRHQAWQGSSDKELRDIWQNLSMFVLYLEDTGTEYLEEITRRRI